MTKQNIIDHLTNDCGLHRSSAIRAVDGVINSISDALSRGEAVTLRGFGTLSVVPREERNAVHFATKEPIVIPAHRSVKFKPSKELKEKLNNGTEL